MIRAQFAPLAILALLLALWPIAAAAGPLGLVEERVRTSFPYVRHVAPDALSAGVRDGAVVIDVREAGEFAVSHLPGAIRVSPETSVSELVARIGDVRGRRVVFYCSVGVRSSKLAEAARRELVAGGATSVENLSGGIFRWHNEGRKLVRGVERTNLVHPYNAFWSVLITRRGLIRYSPRPRGDADIVPGVREPTVAQ